MECAVEIHIEHALEGSVVGVGDGLASGESADQVGQYVDLSEACDHRVCDFFCGIQAVESGRERRELCVVEVGLLDFRRETDDGETGVQHGFGDVRSEAAGGAGDEGYFLRHRE